MGALKPNKEIIINEMIAEMEFGAMRGECLAINSKKWQLAIRTFDRYWQEAGNRFTAAIEKQQKAFEEIRHEMKKEAFKSRILDKFERMEILSEIARGEIIVAKPMVVDGVIQEADVRPDWQSRKAAINELNKMDGSHEPTKKDITSKGEQIRTVVKWGDNEISI